MADESDIKYDGEQFLFADHATDFGSAPATAANTLIRGTPTDVQMDLTGLSAKSGSYGGARQSAKFNFGDPRPSMWQLSACVEWAAAPTDGDGVLFYIGFSNNATAATGNPAGLTGSDAAFTPTAGLLRQLTKIGWLSARNNVINISSSVGTCRPTGQYGILVAINMSDVALRSTATAMDETHLVFDPLAYVPGA